MEDCVKVVEAIKTQNAGNPWPPDEIAKAIKIKSRSSNLSEVIRSANLYGLVDGSYRATAVSLTEIGRRLAYPKSDEELQQAKKDALLSVDLFKRVISHYKDGIIPDSPYINNTLTREFKLNASFHDEFVTVLRKNLGFVDRVFDSKGLAPPLERQAAVATAGSHTSKTRLRVFVIMPFAEHAGESRSEGFFKEVYTSVVKPACERAGFDPSTADRKGSDIIHTTILREILEADIVVADLTDHNPNVMFELGLRMALGSQPVCIIKSKDTGRVFDVDNVLRVYEYSQNLWPSTVEQNVQNSLSTLRLHGRHATQVRATWKF